MSVHLSDVLQRLDDLNERLQAVGVLNPRTPQLVDALVAIADKVLHPNSMFRRAAILLVLHSVHSLKIFSSHP